MVFRGGWGGDGLFFGKKTMFLNGYDLFGSEYHGRKVAAMGRASYFFEGDGRKGLAGGEVVGYRRYFASTSRLTPVPWVARTRMVAGVFTAVKSSETIIVGI